MFTLAVTTVLAALNVFVRDIGNIARHVLRLWFYLSPGLYGPEQLEASSALKDHPQVLRILESNPFATLFDAYRAVIYGTPTGGSGPARLGGARDTARRLRPPPVRQRRGLQAPRTTVRQGPVSPR